MALLSSSLQILDIYFVHELETPMSHAWKSALLVLGILLITHSTKDYPAGIKYLLAFLGGLGVGIWTAMVQYK